MSDDIIVGIDLGTTNSLVAVAVGERPVVVEQSDRGIVPSCVGLDADGKLLVGTEARNQYVAAPERTVLSIKRKMGTREPVALGPQQLTPPEVSAVILRALKARAEEHVGRPVTRAVITVPAYFTDVQRHATREAGELAGLEVVRIINEPTAAALAYDAGADGKQTVMVYDLGGGTFDVSVVDIESGVVEVRASTGNNELGGDDFDALIADELVEHIEEELGLEVRDDPQVMARLERTAEAAKIELSSQPFVTIREDHIGEVDGEPVHLTYELSRHDFEDMIEDLLDETMEAVTRAMADAKVQASDLDKLLLVGGSTRIPCVAERLANQLGLEPHAEVDPDLCVVLGAALQAGMEAGHDMRSVLVDVTPYTFGTRTLDDSHGFVNENKFVPIIRRNSRLPARHTEAFYALYPDQDEIHFEVYEGEDPDAKKNVLVGTFELKDVNKNREAYDKGVLLSYNLNLDGMLEVHAIERGTNKEVRGVIENVTRKEATGELESSRERVAALFGSTDADVRPQSVPAELGETLRRAQRALAEAHEKDQEEIRKLVGEIQQAVGDGQLDRAGTLRSQLEDILFYLD
jgi:molecular chaperone DnaK (HSP70)